MTRRFLITGACLTAFLGAAAAYLLSTPATARIPYTDAVQIADGKRVYQQYCASCHGANLEGEPNWQRRDSAGMLPAPPHDPTGHTWHHPDTMLFEFVKYGPKHFAGADYVTKMPPYEDVLTDSDIWAVLAYIKSTWPNEILVRHNQFGDK